MSAVTNERRQLGLGAAIAVVTGESIALGIFLTPAAMAKSLASPFLLGSIWVAMAIMAADPTTQKWWAVCKPCQRPLDDRAPDEWWSGMEEVFHVD